MLTGPISENVSNAPVVLGITGASASILGFRLLQQLLLLNQSVELIVSRGALPVIWDELKLQLPSVPAEQVSTVLAYLGLADTTYGPQLTCYTNKIVGERPASGTHVTRGMVIVPCSMTTLGKIASGVSDNLICRAADVTMKERRNLIIVPREAPLNEIHLENMLRLRRMGVAVIPPVLSFYQPAFHSVDGQINYTVGKVLEQLGFHQHNLFPQWEGKPSPLAVETLC